MTELELKYSSAALRDLTRIHATMLSSGIDTANRFIRGLLDRIAEDAIYPKPRLPLCYEDGYTGYYYASFEGFSAFYRVEDGLLYVDRVLSKDSALLRSMKQLILC